MKKLSLLPKLALSSTLCLVFASSCSQKASAPQTSLGIQTPIVSGVSAITPAIVASTPYVNSGLWGLATPTTLAEIDCYAIAVSYAEGTNNSCHLFDGGLIDIDEMFGPVPAGDVLNGDITSGTSRNIQVIGFATADGSCPSDITALTKAQMANSSAPVILGSTVTDVTGDQMDVDVVISMSNPVAINDCAGEKYVWEEGAATPSQFNVENGYLTVTGSNLGSVHSAVIKDPAGNQTELSVESRNNNGLALKALSAFNIAMSTVYELLVSNAYGQQVFNISVGGNSGYNVVNVTADTTITNAQNQSLFLVTGSRTLTLPTAADAGAGFNIIIKSIGTGYDGTILVSTQNSETIDTTSNHLVLNSHLATINLTSDGSNWWMLSSNGTVQSIVGTIPTCDNVTCYSDSSLDYIYWAKHTATGKLMNRGYSGDLWRLPFIYTTGAGSGDKYLIDNNANSTNSSYSFTKYDVVGRYYDEVLFHNVSGNKWIGPSNPSSYSGGSARSIQSYFWDYTSGTGVNHANNTSGVAEDGFLNTFTFTTSFQPYYECHGRGGKMYSTTDGLTTLPEVGVTYWTADYAWYDGTGSVPYYKTVTYDGTSVTESDDSWSAGHEILCVWDDVVTSFALE